MYIYIYIYIYTYTYILFVIYYIYYILYMLYIYLYLFTFIFIYTYLYIYTYIFIHTLYTLTIHVSRECKCKYQKWSSGKCPCECKSIREHNVDPNEFKTNEKSYKNILIYYIWNVTVKYISYEKINSVNPLYVINIINGYIEVPLEIRAAASVIDAGIWKKTHGSGATTLIISNE